MNKQHTIDMVDGPLLKNIILFSIPVILQNLLQILFNAADTIVVGKFAGDEALAAVGSTGSLCFMVIALFMGLTSGANVIVAKHIGAKDKESASKASHTSMLLSILCGVPLTFFGLIISKPMLKLMSTPDSIIDLSALYLKIYFIGVVFILIYNFGAAILRSKGDTKRPLYYLLIGGTLNVVLNLIFVIYLKWSVAGVAAATVISNAVIAVLVVIALMKDNDSTKLELKKLRIDLSICKNIFSIGIPAGIQSMMYALSNMIIQSSINSFDSAKIVAGNSAAANIENFIFVGLNFCFATLSFTSQNVGAKRKENVSKICKLTMLLDIGTAVVLSAIVYTVGRYLLMLYTDDPAVIEIGFTRITWVGLFVVLNAILDIFIYSLRGMGISTLPTTVMIIGICGIRYLWLATVFKSVGTLTSIYLCYPVSWIITSILLWAMWVYYHKRFMNSNSLVQ